MGQPSRIAAIVVSSQHADGVSHEQISQDIRRHVIDEILPQQMMDESTRVYINPTGRFVTGGPMGDAGLTGRKIIVDTYGGAAPHGGGAFSGKDPTKVDRSAAYAARYLAKNVVAAGMAEKCTIQLSYAIGIAKPLSIYADTYGTGQVHESEIEKAVAQVMNLTPRGIREHLQLNKPIYTRTAAYGHFGRQPDEDGGFSWEKTDLVEALKKAV
jgi:S-adenosylmethionine synthetase